MRPAFLRRPSPVHEVEVTAVTPLTSTLTQLTLAGPTLPSLAVEHPTQWVKLAVPHGRSGSVSRAYTIRHHRPERQEVDIDIVLHGNGPLARWAATAHPGATAHLAGPRGRLQSFDGAAHLLLAADESALPAALTILEQLPPALRVFAYFEIAVPGDTLPFTTPAETTVNWLPRTTRPKGRLLADTLLAADLPTTPGAAWLAGEASAVATLRRHLLNERGYSRDLVQSKGYWKHGESDHKGKEPA